MCAKPKLFDCDQAIALTNLTEIIVTKLNHPKTASRFFDLGLDMVGVSTVTGHKTLQILKRYAHLRAQKLAAKLG